MTVPSDARPERPATEPDRAGAEAPTGRTGHPVVDGVLDAITAGADRPPAERAEGLAAAHERLHAVLDEHRRPGPAAS